jgi:tRNA/tmRNA/rRNA uracil-C5-methylase (TrmA/RlmC/RlmD family)
VKPQQGDLIELEVSKVVHGGFGLARHDGFVIFAKGALPGEVVSVRLTDIKKSHAYADLIEVLSPSAHRVEHLWPEAGLSRAPDNRAGGADYGHIKLDYQRELKTEILHDALIRFGRLDPSVVETARVNALSGDESGDHWRTRVTLHVNDDGQAGPFAEGTHRVIPVETLPLATEAIQNLGAHQMEWRGHQRIRIVDTLRDTPCLIIDTQKPEPITQWVGDTPFRLSDHSFWQVHRSAAQTLFDDVVRRLSSLTIDPQREQWDLYGGVGLFGRAMGETLGKKAKIVSVEADEDSTEFAAENLKDFVGARALASSAEKFVLERAASQQASSVPIGAVVLDPPRSGAGKKVIDALVTLRPLALIYVACDPVALGRDVGLLREHGYAPRDIAGVDLFPNTHHFETVVTLTRADS